MKYTRSNNEGKTSGDLSAPNLIHVGIFDRSRSARSYGFSSLLGRLSSVVLFAHLMRIFFVCVLNTFFKQ